MLARVPVDTVGAQMRTRLAGFVRTLRDNGFAAGAAESRDALAILASPLARRRSSLEPALRALFCADRSDWEKFGDIFAAFWTGRGVRSMQKASGHAPKTDRTPERTTGSRGGERGQALADHVERRGDDGDITTGGTGRREGASRAESIATTDIRHIADPDGMARAHELAARLAARMQARLVRRMRARSSGRRIDMRRTIHRSVTRGGVPVELAWRKPKRKPLRLVVLLDASGSMSLYTAFFVRFLHGVVNAFAEADVFLFHTRLVHVSPSLKDRNVQRAVDRLSLIAQGIGGGTKIGESLADFNRWHAKRMIHSRTAVIVVSDGYDTGTPEQLAAQMRQLRRRCRRIAWLNPLIGWNGYSPDARGMKAALPFIDLFAPAHNLESLAALEPYLARI